METPNEATPTERECSSKTPTSPLIEIGRRLQHLVTDEQLEQVRSVVAANKHKTAGSGTNRVSHTNPKGTPQ